jgi:hypothetical protein
MEGWQSQAPLINRAIGIVTLVGLSMGSVTPLTLSAAEVRERSPSRAHPARAQGAEAPLVCEGIGALSSDVHGAPAEVTIAARVGNTLGRQVRYAWTITDRNGTQTPSRDLVTVNLRPGHVTIELVATDERDRSVTCATSLDIPNATSDFLGACTFVEGSAILGPPCTEILSSIHAAADRAEYGVIVPYVRRTESPVLARERASKAVDYLTFTRGVSGFEQGRARDGDPRIEILRGSTGLFWASTPREGTPQPQPRPSITVREFVSPDGRVAEGLGLYSYVLLPHPPSRSERALFAEVLGTYLLTIACAEDAKVGGKGGIEMWRYPNRELHVVYTPVKKPPTSCKVSADWMLDDGYDYVAAQHWAGAVCDAPHDGPLVISTFEPLQSAGSCLPRAQYMVQDFSRVPPRFVGFWMTEFLRRSSQPRTWTAQTLVDLAFSLRKAVADYAGPFKDAKAVVEALGFKIRFGA